MLMRDEALAHDTSLEQLPETVEEPSSPRLEPAPPITNRFLLVNVAAHRAKQLHKGASPRLSDEDLASLGSAKAERLAMEEIARGLVHYDVPAWTAPEVEQIIVSHAKRRARR
jgi:DNA-directed RNA polymerase omega subunit